MDYDTTGKDASVAVKSGYIETSLKRLTAPFAFKPARGKPNTSDRLPFLSPVPKKSAKLTPPPGYQAPVTTRFAHMVSNTREPEDVLAIDAKGSLFVGDPSEISAKLGEFKLEYYQIDLFNGNYPSLSSLKKAMKLSGKLEGEELNDAFEKKMLNKLGYCFYLCNSLLYLKIHSALKYTRFLIPIGHVFGNQLQFYNREDSALFQAKVFIEYDNVRPISMREHGTINTINSVLFPRGCKIRIRWDVMDSFTKRYANVPDERIDWSHPKGKAIFSFTELRTPDSQAKAIRRLRKKFVELNENFDKDDDSIRNYVEYYYANILI